VIAREANLQRELLLVGNRTPRQPVLHLTPHIRPPVGVVVVGTGTPETYLVHVVEAQRAQSLHDPRGRKALSTKIAATSFSEVLLRSTSPASATSIYRADRTSIQIASHSCDQTTARSCMRLSLRWSRDFNLWKELELAKKMSEYPCSRALLPGAARADALSATLRPGVGGPRSHSHVRFGSQVSCGPSISS
jgi:hypothetical protein